jgi:hypothetical protein
MSLCKEEKSELVFGWYDQTKFSGEMKWHPVVYKYFWALKLDDIKVSISLLVLSLFPPQLTVIPRYLVRWEVTENLRREELPSYPRLRDIHDNFPDLGI